MNGQNFEEPINPPDNVKQPDQGANGPVLISDPFADKAPLDEALIHEAPIGGTVAAIGPMDETIVQDTPKGETVTHEAPPPMNAGSLAALLSREESELLRKRWIEIQGKFVDEPRSAVQQADALVSEVVEKIIQMFASEHSSLEGQWNQGIDVSTEDLRKALQHYRSFFNRLVV
jgi:hypothetical protein